MNHSRQRRVDIVDVFAEKPFEGNPLPVVLDAGGLNGDDMMRITRWMNQSETAFLLPPTLDGADYRVRIFTLERELPFAGHPTLGACDTWLRHGGTPAADDVIVQECGAGLIRIRRAGERLAFAAPPLQRGGPVDPDRVAMVSEVLDIDSSAMEAVEWADNGPGWVLVLLSTAQAVLDLAPLRSHAQRVDIGVLGPCAADESCAWELRTFFSDADGLIREDPVTGSFNAAAAQWLVATGRARAPWSARQGTALGRSGRIEVFEKDGDLWIGGRVIPIMSGHSVASFTRAAT